MGITLIRGGAQLITFISDLRSNSGKHVMESGKSRKTDLAEL